MPKRRSLFAAVATLTMLAIGVVATPAQAAGFTPMNIWKSSHCLDNATEDASKLHMWNCTGGSEQRWLDGFNTQTGFFTFTNQRTGRCVTAPASGPGTVTAAFCDAAATTQQWRVFFADNPLGPPSGWYQVWQNVSSGYCMTTPSVANGTRIQTTICDPSDLYDRWHKQ